ncbi:MAG: hypothetical protein JNM51_16705, partial [Bacteroidia bacterium]|nr:hypothetical protein [Bacteroidia bacterium]
MKFFYLCILFISFTKIYSQNILISTGGTVNVVGGEFFYDAGGAAGNDGNTSYTITLAPAVSGEKVCLDFTSFKTMFSASAEDPLYIYDGPTATGLNIGKLMGDYSIKTGNGTTPYGVGRGLANSADVNNIFKPTLFSATNSTGCLTLVFQNNSSSQNFGWVANVLTYKDLGIPGCSINLTASTNTICSGQNAVLTTTGNLVASALNNNFNGSLGTGWVGTPSATIVTNVCASPSLDGSQYLWMQNSAVPRSLESLAMDVSTGGTISFEYRQAKFNSDPSPCEAPDILMSGTTNEGIFVQYSTNNGVTWNTFKYLFSNSLYSNSGTADAYNNGCGDYVTRWTKMTYPIPTAAKTTSTKFRWIQPAGTSASTDNWGLDNVIIGSPKTFTITLKDLTNNSVLITSTLSPLSFTVNPTATNVYEAIITDGVTSCTSTQTITVSGGASPVTSFSYTNPYCANGTIANPTLAAGFTTGGTFSSTPTGLSINSSSGIVALSSSTTGTYVVTYTVPASGCGVATNSTASIIINPTPSLTVNSATICSGSTTTLTATGATTYSWNTGATTSTIATVPISTTNYTITGTTNGCSSSKTTTINVTAQPTITINTATICSGANAILNPTGATTYSWNTGATSSSLNVSPTTTTVYTVTGTTNNCSSTKTTTVNVTQTPTISASSATICSGGTATLTASGGASYTWSPGASTN